MTRRPARLLAVALAVWVMLLVAAAAGAPRAGDPGDAAGPVDLRDRGHPVALGFRLDWATDSATALAGRLQHEPTAVAHTFAVPLGDAERTWLRQFGEQAAAVGAAAVVGLAPRGGPAGVDAAAAADVAREIRALTDRAGVPVLVVFGPEMNGSWQPWGQRPGEYREAYRRVAAALRSAAPAAQLVWQPASGADYPFLTADAARQLPPERAVELDTDGDGELDGADDPYGPYYPGDDVVDWVGLSLVAGDQSDVTGDNTVPPPGAFAADVAPFAQRWAGDHPLMLDTAARYVPDRPGAEASAVQTAWLDQAVAAAAGPVPALRLLVWREQRSATVDQRITAPGPALDAVRALLDAGSVLPGPVVSPADGTAADGGVQVRGWAAWLVVGAVLAATVALLRFGFSRRRADWRYPEERSRDERIDLLRGVAICFVVVNHINLPSLYQVLTQEAIGPVSGAELFVILSGVVLGAVYRPRVMAAAPPAVTATLLRRAGKLYLVALCVVISVYLISLVPGVRAAAVTTFTDQGTGAAGAGAAGRVYDLYAGMDGLLDYPVPGSTLADLFLLRMGPWQFNVMGLYVLMLLAAPVLLWLLRGRLVLVVLAVSWAVYLVNLLHPVRLLPSQFEDSFPLLSWQVLFVHGIVAGWYRRELLTWFRRPVGSVVLVLAVLVAVVLMLFTWTNPYQANVLDPRLDLLDPGTFRALYDPAFPRTHLAPGRLLDVFAVLITLFAVLSRFWTPIRRAVGGFLIPMGSATLYVFILHVFVVLALANLPWLPLDDVWVSTAVETAVLALLWLAVRTRFLFRVIPR